MKKRTKWIFSLHHWLGLLAGLFLLISSITGTALVFHHEIDEAQFSDVSTLAKPARALHIDHSFTRIRELYPGADIRLPGLPAAADQALKYEIREKGERRWVFVHPETGEILATFERADQRLVHVLLELHYMLLAGTTGKVLVLLGGIALFVLSLSGIFLYRKSIGKVLLFRQQVSFKSRRSFFSSLHRIVGVWSLLFNLLLCITGSWIAFTIVQSAFSSPAVPAKEPAAATASIDASLRQMQQEYPSFEIKYLRFPMQSGDKLAVMGRLQADPAFYGRTLSSMQIDLHTGQVEGVRFARDLPWQQRAVKVLKPLHFGDYAGLGVKLLYAFFGLLPAVLAISGFLLWCYRPQKKGRQQAVLRSRPLQASSAS